MFFLQGFRILELHKLFTWRLVIIFKKSIMFHPPITCLFYKNCLFRLPILLSAIHGHVLIQWIQLSQNLPLSGHARKIFEFSVITYCLNLMTWAAATPFSGVPKPQPQFLLFEQEILITWWHQQVSMAGSDFCAWWSTGASFTKRLDDQISRSLEDARVGVEVVRSLWNLAGVSAAVLPICLPNFRAIV